MKWSQTLMAICLMMPLTVTETGSACPFERKVPLREQKWLELILTVYSTAQPPELRNSWPMREKLIEALPPMLNVSHVICAAFILNIITETRKHQEYLTSGILLNLTGNSNIFFWGVCKTFSHTNINSIAGIWKHQ